MSLLRFVIVSLNRCLYYRHIGFERSVLDDSRANHHEIYGFMSTLIRFQSVFEHPHHALLFLSPSFKHWSSEFRYQGQYIEDYYFSPVNSVLLVSQTLTRRPSVVHAVRGQW